jgi:hypothetical protein
MSLLQKTLQYRWGSAEIAPTLNVKLWDPVTAWWRDPRFLEQPEHRNRSEPFRILNLHQKNLAGDQQHFVVCRWAAALSGGQCASWRRWAPEGQCTPWHQACRHTPTPRQGPTPILCTATAGGLTAVQTYVSAASKTLPATPTRRR